MRSTVDNRQRSASRRGDVARLAMDERPNWHNTSRVVLHDTFRGRKAVVTSKIWSAKRDFE